MSCCGNDNFLWTSSLKCKEIYRKYPKALMKIMFLVSSDLDLTCAKGNSSPKAF